MTKYLSYIIWTNTNPRTTFYLKKSQRDGFHYTDQRHEAHRFDTLDEAEGVTPSCFVPTGRQTGIEEIDE